MPPARRPHPNCNCRICNMNLIRTEEEIEQMVANLNPINAATPWIDNNEPVGPGLVNVGENGLNWAPLTPAQTRIYMESIMIIACGHVFHKSCLWKHEYRSVRLGRPMTCPVCQRPIADEIRLFPTLDHIIVEEDRVAPGWRWGPYERLVKPFQRAYRSSRPLLIFGGVVLAFLINGSRAKKMFQRAEAVAEDEDLLTLSMQPFNIEMSKLLIISAYLMVDIDLEILRWILGFLRF